MGIYSTLAEAFRYPSILHTDRLEEAVAAVPESPARVHIESFLQQVKSRSLGEWEEMYTRTWDLEPFTPPYIGFQIWGEDYRRGNFLACLQGAYRKTGIETGGELADHLVPVLSYLDCAPDPVDELIEVFNQAIQKMCAALQKSDPSNPYLELLAAVKTLIPQPENQPNHKTGLDKVAIPEKNQ